MGKLDLFRLDNNRIDGGGGSGNAQPADVLAGLTFTNDEGEQLGTLIKDMQVVSGAVATGLSGTISNLALKPFAIVFGVYLSSEYASNTTVYSRSQGFIFAYKSGDSFIAPRFLMTDANGSPSSRTSTLTVTSVVFGPNSVQFTVTLGGGGTARNSGITDYYILGN